MSGIQDNRFNIIRWILAGSIVLCCLGYTINTLRYTDKIFTILWNELYLDWSESLAMQVSEWGAISMLLAAIAGSFYRLRGAQVFVFAWFLFSVICTYIVEHWHPHYLVGASAIRTISPLLCLLFLSRGSGSELSQYRLRVFEWGMRICVALTFFYHGHECLAAKAQFLDYIQSVVRMFGMNGISSASSLAVLKMIGIMDILVALAILIPFRLYLIAAWMSFWGLSTGFVRIIFAGWDTYPEFLLRIIHGTLPICLILLWSSQTTGESEFKKTKKIKV